MNAYAEMSREDLLKALEMFAKNWLAHDGAWFLAAEERFRLYTAMELDALAWERFAASEAKRIMSTFGIAAGGGLEALARALSLRMYALVNEQHLEWAPDRSRLRFFMDACRVQATRRAKGLPEFPCRSVGVVEFSTFARTIDPRIRSTCLHCPPDSPHGPSCGWEFTLADEDGAST